jgi:hypothetical protein
LKKRNDFLISKYFIFSKTRTLRKNFTSLIILSVLIFSSWSACAQNVAIGTLNAVPDARAVLDIQSSNKGILIPRVSLIDNNNPISGTKPIGLMVWNDNSAFKAGAGFYFWNSNSWQAVIYYPGTGISLDSNNVITALPNSLNQAGIVPAPTLNNKNATYVTDNNGNPAWKTEDKTMYYINKF